MMRQLSFLLASSLLLGCPKKSPEPVDPTADTASAPMPTRPSPTTSATASTLKGGWRVEVSSDDPSVNPAMFEGKRAKIFFAHKASVKEGRVLVEHAELAPSTASTEDGETLDALLHDTDWAALEKETAAEEPPEGGTTFVIQVERGESKHRITTSNPADYPALSKLLDLLKKTSGAPG